MTVSVSAPIDQMPIETRISIKVGAYSQTSPRKKLTTLHDKSHALFDPDADNDEDASYIKSQKTFSCIWYEKNNKRYDVKRKCGPDPWE